MTTRRIAKRGGDTEIQTTQERIDKVKTMLGNNMEAIETALANMLDPKQFLRICMTTFQRGGKNMLAADPRSFVAACVEAAQLQMKPDSVLGDCYLIPRRDKESGLTLVNFQLGYRGAIKIVRRSGEVGDISPEVAYENDEFNVQYGTDRLITHRPWFVLGKSEPGKVIAAYNVAELKDGRKSFRVVTRDKLLEAAERSGDPRDKKWSNVWMNHFDEMAMKTAIWRHTKRLPVQDDAARILARDELRDSGMIDDDMKEMIERIKDMTHTTKRKGPRSLDDLLSKDEGDGVLEAEATEPDREPDPPPPDDPG